MEWQADGTGGSSNAARHGIIAARNCSVRPGKIASSGFRARIVVPYGNIRVIISARNALQQIEKMDDVNPGRQDGGGNNSVAG